MTTRIPTETGSIEHMQTKSVDRPETSGGSDEVIFLRLPEVRMVTGLSKSSLYALIRAKSFPAPVRLGPRTVAWVRTEVKQWAAERVLTSRSAPARPGNKRMPQPEVGRTWVPLKKWA
jgi:prophage regulatory protein